MKQSNKKDSGNRWKLILLAFEVIVIIFIVWVLFSTSWTKRPEKYRNLTIEQESYSRVAEEVCNIGYLTPSIPKEPRERPNDPTFEEIVAFYVFDICQSYPEIDPYIVLGIIYHESRFTPNVSAGKCVGLMQISTYWHKDRAARLGVSDFWDPYGNILIGVDLLNELLGSSDGDIFEALLLYRGRQYKSYAKGVIDKANEYREGDIYGAWSSTGKNSSRTGGPADLSSI